MNEDYIVRAVLQVNYPKSIARRRLIYNINGDLIFDYVISSGIILMFTFFAILPTLAFIRGSHVPVWLILCGLLFLGIIILSIIYRSAFVIIPGTDVPANRQKIKEVLNVFYDDLNFQIDNDNILRSLKPCGSVFYGRAITVLFDADIIYLNISALGKCADPTFSHSLLSYRKARKIAQYYNSL